MSGRPVRRRVLADVVRRGGWESVLARIARGEQVAEIARWRRDREVRDKNGGRFVVPRTPTLPTRYVRDERRRNEALWRDRLAT
jgi:hypothetical protein